MKQFPTLSGKALLSPMSGVTDVAFRSLCKEYGAALTYTEFTHSSQILAGAADLRIYTAPNEDVVAVQLFGDDVDEVVAAAKHVEEDFDVIDVNCGCPAWNVIKSGAGSALLNDPEKIAELIHALDRAVQIPVTLKIRSGTTKNSVNAVEVAQAAENAGAAAIGVHGRTSKQGYKGKSDWGVIKDVKRAVGISVIGNGDVFTPETFKERLDETGVDYILLARGAMGHPYIFKQIQDYLAKEEYDEPDKISLFFDYVDKAKMYGIEFNTVKRHAMQFTKGIPHSSKLRRELIQTSTTEELVSEMRNWNADLKQ